ncbi:Imm10 family immunity protein [Labrys wisconsinensis]|uniref:Uncharacterized protein n=1 Tax=Labrys wisconsinensis TaxID=425677 RepID=A0ABU0J840_9HYPH|nr:Imm10 family immunity protein [Labrys wisconsinensis]MDQ0469770.1 hypothetical protein [Labrys wisconsinensis]
MNFSARYIHIEDDGEGLTVGFADHSHDPDNYVTLDLAHEPDEQDLRLGMDGLHIDTSISHINGYNIVEKVELCDDRLMIMLKMRFAEKVRVDPIIKIGLNDPSAEHSKLDEAITKLKTRLP